MKAKLLAAWAAVSPWLSKAWSAAYGTSQLALGIVLGYLGHGLIKLALDAALGLLKSLLKL